MFGRISGKGHEKYGNKGKIGVRKDIEKSVVA